MTRTFIVQGPRVGFPLDMLRYDCAWPDSSDDAETIRCSLSDDFDRLPRRIKVRLRTEDRMAPSRQRWESFGYEVLS